ncbi:hypothetical protein ONZ45_g13931 [Pleurotus djamor]|nr:hypothetical protein ONZ45_g13931 [Pleurotus djamor]
MVTSWALKATSIVLFGVAVAIGQQLAFFDSDLVDITKEPWHTKYGPQHDTDHTGPLSFAHIPYARCLEDASKKFDIAILGLPHDTTTSGRPGARFGPSGIRGGSMRMFESSGYTVAWGHNPFKFDASIMDCGDVPLTRFDNAKAIDQMEVAYSTLLMRPVEGGIGRDDRKSRAFTAHLAKDGKEHPRLISLGGDHTIVLPILRALNKIYGPVSVIHFDAHLAMPVDTWSTLGPNPSEQEKINHGTFFSVAADEHLIRNNSVHAGIRCPMWGIEDVQHDETVGFQLITTDDLDDYGIQAIIQGIRRRVGTSPVYLSLDIDVIDPGIAPATGTPEAGGWTPREVKRILRGLSGLNFVGADIVEVAPAYDHAEVTSIVAANIVQDFLSMFQTDTPPKPHDSPLLKNLSFKF